MKVCLCDGLLLIDDVVHAGSIVLEEDVEAVGVRHLDQVAEVPDEGRCGEVLDGDHGDAPCDLVAEEVGERFELGCA